MILRVDKRHEIRLSSSRVSQERLKAFIVEQKEWIMHQHESINEPFQRGGSFYYLAQPYKIEHHQKPMEMREDTIYLNPLKAKKQCDDFYKYRAREYLSERVIYWKEKMGLEFHDLRFRCAKRRWGSCNSKGVITFNPYMMKLGYEMIDYIIVHELAHLEHMNHSKDFYSLIHKYMPDYVNIQNQIKLLSKKIN